MTEARNLRLGILRKLWKLGDRSSMDWYNNYKGEKERRIWFER